MFSFNLKPRFVRKYAKLVKNAARSKGKSKACSSYWLKTPATRA